MSLTEEMEKLQRFDIVYDFGDTYVGGQEDGEYLNRDEVLELIESYIHDDRIEEEKNFFRKLGEEMAEKRSKLILQGFYDG